MRLVLFLIAFASLAQTPEQAARVAEIETRFAAGTPPDLAWAARLAGDYRLRQFVPQVIDLLKHSDQQVRNAAWDALVTLRAYVPGSVLEPVIRNTNNDAALILAALNSPELAGRLLDENRLNNKTWIVLTGALFPAGNAARLLRYWEMPVTVIVTSGRTTPFLPTPDYGSGVCGDVGPERPSPYPPFRFGPRIQSASKAGETLLTTGPHPVTYASSSCTMGSLYDIPREEYTLDFLRALAKFDEAPPNPVIRYTNAAQYRAAANTALTNLRRYYNRLHTALIAKGAIPPNDRTIPPLKVTIEDQRANRLPALPEVRWQLATQQNQR